MGQNLLIVIVTIFMIVIIIGDMKPLDDFSHVDSIRRSPEQFLSKEMFLQLLHPPCCREGSR